jgi:hypothetical protein
MKRTLKSPSSDSHVPRSVPEALVRGPFQEERLRHAASEAVQLNAASRNSDFGGEMNGTAASARSVEGHMQMRIRKHQYGGCPC